MTTQPFWENSFRNPIQLPLIYSYIVADRGAGGAVCDAMRDGFGCSREPGHPAARHIAVGGGIIAAAWPGAHRPTFAELALMSDEQEEQHHKAFRRRQQQTTVTTVIMMLWVAAAVASFFSWMSGDQRQGISTVVITAIAFLTVVASGRFVLHVFREHLLHWPTCTRRGGAR